MGEVDRNGGACREGSSHRWVHLRADMWPAVPCADIWPAVPCADIWPAVPCADMWPAVPCADIWPAVPCADIWLAVPCADIWLAVPCADIWLAVPCSDIWPPVPCSDIGPAVPCADIWLAVPCSDIWPPVPCSDIGPAVPCADIWPAVLRGAVVRGCAAEKASIQRHGSLASVIVRARKHATAALTLNVRSVRHCRADQKRQIGLERSRLLIVLSSSAASGRSGVQPRRRSYRSWQESRHSLQSLCATSGHRTTRCLLTRCSPGSIASYRPACRCNRPSTYRPDNVGTRSARTPSSGPRAIRAVGERHDGVEYVAVEVAGIERAEIAHRHVE
jgi:hypothetical protein